MTPRKLLTPQMVSDLQAGLLFLLSQLDRITGGRGTLQHDL